MFVLGLIVGLMIGVGAGFAAAALCQASKDADGDDFEREAGLFDRAANRVEAAERAADAFERDGVVRVRAAEDLERGDLCVRRTVMCDDGEPAHYYVRDTPELRKALAAWDGTERRSAPRVSMTVPVAVRVLEQVQHNPYKRIGS